MTIKLIGTHSGEPTQFDGEYVMEYDASWRPVGYSYDGGRLTTSPHIEDARQFATLAEAVAYYRQSHGFRPDGEPNRPLTAWTVEIS